MKTSRQTSIPIDHIIAELAAFPIVSTAAFQFATTSLCPLMKDATGYLWRYAEKELLSSFPALSVDEMVSMRDKIWFQKNTLQPVPLHLFIGQLANMYLESDGPCAIPRLPSTNQYDEGGSSCHIARIRNSWRWLSLAIPPDLLLAAMGDEHSGPDSIDLLSPILNNILRENGYAETHLHVGAAMDFSTLWNGLLNNIAQYEMKSDSFQSPGACFGEGKYLGGWLLRAAIARYILAAYLFECSEKQTFSEFLQNNWRVRFLKKGRLTDFVLLLRVLNELETGWLSKGCANFAQLQSVYKHICGIAIPTNGVFGNDPGRSDPIAHLTAKCGPTDRSPEIIFVARALKKMKRDKTAGKTFTVLFWQVIRLRTIFYRHIVHRPMTPGLQWFIRFYGRIKPARGGIKGRTSIENAARIDGLGKGLYYLEIRTSPEDNISDAIGYIKEFKNAAAFIQEKQKQISSMDPESTKREKEFEIGLVYHISKDRGGGAFKGKPKAYWRESFADPYVHGYRYSGFYRNKLKEAQTVEWLLRTQPNTLQWIRGIDVCTDELGVPNWVVAPIIHRIKDAAGDAAISLKNVSGLSVSKLRTTAHVGEDFLHLLTGLRNVHEVITNFKLRKGDRIGHGICLGIDPFEWAQRAGRIPMAAGDRLEDLVWEWEYYGDNAESSDSNRKIAIEYKIARLSEMIYGECIAPYDLARLKQDLYNPWMLYDVGFPDGPVLSGKVKNRRCGLLNQYLTDPNVFLRERKIIWVVTDNEGETLAWLQAHMRRHLGSMGICVEINPSSNLLIGDLSDLTSHPMWRLRPPKNDGDAPRVALSIGSDDPLLFGSNIRHEYQYLADAMTLAGLSDDEVYQWIDGVRECGIHRRFTIRPEKRIEALGILNYRVALRHSPI